MSVTIKAGKISECLDALNKIVDASDDAKNNIPFEASYWALRMSKKLKGEEESFMKERDKLLEKYGERILENGVFTGQFKFSDKDKALQFNNEVLELSNVDIVVEGISSKPFSAFGTEFKNIYASLKVLLDVLVIDDYKEQV